MPHGKRTTPPTLDAQLVRDAGDLFGSEALARALGVSSRSFYQWASGERPVRGRVLSEIRQHLIAHRQRTFDLIRVIRAREAELAAEAAEPQS